MSATRARNFTRVLVANRGEIAVRVIRTLRDLGMTSIAVYSEPDRTALHVVLADEAYPIGPAPARESYLNAERLLEVARQAGAEAVHPGYGFLSENATFAAACEQAGLVFIGPSPESIHAMGNKLAARALAREAGAPLVPGSPGPVTSIDETRRVAAEIGYPVLLKAAAGGGGKGMRMVEREGDLERAFSLVRGEARSAFGDDEVYVERYVTRPRHVEAQILADEHGAVAFLGERECSVQRRHQKVVEETPSPALNDETRRKLGEAACAIARAARYRNAGTVEFIVDESGAFYFLEMNTRLQVEHPVTEMVTGLDLVEQQIRIARGEPLELDAQAMAPRGAALECRVYAENPWRDFLPSTGPVRRLRWPHGPGVRVDAGVYRGYTVPMYYDPLLAKIVTWGADRDQAIRRMRRALAETAIEGLTTNLALHRWILEEEEFVSGDYDTHFLPRRFTAAALDPDRSEERVALLAASLHEYTRAQSVTLPKPRTGSWRWGRDARPQPAPNGRKSR